MGEGAGIISTRRIRTCKKEEQKIYAEVVGFGSTSDAYHITSPCPDGEGGAKCNDKSNKDRKNKTRRNRLYKCTWNIYTLK